MPLLPESDEPRLAQISAWQPPEISSSGAARPVGKPSLFQAEGAPAPGPAVDFVPILETELPAWQPPQADFAPQAYSVAHAAGDSAPELWSPPELEPSASAFACQGRLVSSQSPASPSAASLGGWDTPAQHLLQEAQAQAEAIVRQALARADEIVYRAEAEAEQITQQAHAQAAAIAARARQEGLEAAHAKTADLLRTAASIVEQVKAWRDDLLNQGEMMMLRLVIEIAQTLFGDGLPLEPEVLGQAFSRALAEARSLGDLRIYVHPEDAALLGPHWVQQQTVLSGQRMELVASEVIKRGGCYVEGQFGSVDARVETQFQKVKEALLSTAGQPLAAAPGDEGGQA